MQIAAGGRNGAVPHRRLDRHEVNSAGRRQRELALQPLAMLRFGEVFADDAGGGHVGAALVEVALRDATAATLPAIGAVLDPRRADAAAGPSSTRSAAVTAAALMPGLSEDVSPSISSGHQSQELELAE
jgi:hypothetical protein